ncbi:SAM-dependent methyltransferase [Sphaerisporangium sp. NPDC049002]|uniref:SAM-dependent methyltransferase n=1 Tax=Sphaerisporangium sp. NPDC049002 TaxID=3155392 RepID=UPI0033F5ABD2
MNRPGPAGVYQCFLGQDKDATPAERQLAAEVLASNPAIRQMAQDNRRFLGRAVRYAVGEAGIRQILDIGTGFPTNDNGHQVARKVAPDVTTVYVDNDKRVTAHGRAFLDDEKSTHFLYADVRIPGELQYTTRVQRLLDFDQPIALMLVAVLHFVEKQDEPYNIVDSLVGALAPGSLVVISHALDDESLRPGARTYQRATSRAVLRTATEVGAFFKGLDVVDPGLVAPNDWRPEQADLVAPLDRVPVLCGIGRKP